MLLVEGISKDISGKRILSDIDLYLHESEKLAIAGETGSGKSSLLKIIAGLVQPDSGVVLFDGKKVLGPDEQLIAGHPAIGYLSQHFELRNNYFVHEILEYANKLSDEQASQIFHICQIEHLLGRKTNDGLSGGEKQRIATARLLINKPRLLLLDEPFSNLDMGHKQIMKDIIHQISDSLKITLVMVSHDPDDILPWAHRILIIKDGRIIQNATPFEIYYKPVNEYAAGLTGKYNTMPDGSMLRPDDLELTEGPDGLLKGFVQSCSFYGDHYEFVVRDGSKTYLAYSSKPLQVGTSVFLKKK